MTPFFTRERFGSPQVIAALLLLIYLLQCAWLVSRELRSQQSTSIGEQERIHAGLLQWQGKGVAGTPGSNASAETGVTNNEFDSNRSPLWYLIASAPLAALSPESSFARSVWPTRLPYFLFGV